MQADLISGLTVGVMAVPQSVSFAAMAGLPAAFGLYTAFVPVLAYCLMGSSRHLVSIAATSTLPDIHMYVYIQFVCCSVVPATLMIKHKALSA